MSRRSLTASLAPTVQSIWKSSSHRLLQHSSRTYSSTIQITTSATPILSSGSSSTSSPREAIKRRKLNDLNDSIAHDGNPSRVWSHYTSLLNFLGYEKLPLKLHQDVLRKCTATAVELRVSAARHLHGNHKSSDPHVYEGRFQTIIRNIRATGMKPTLDDYHFILEQFAAVGHHAGAMQVYKELVGLGLEPRTKTFGLCLQAIAHHLTFPVQPVHQAQRIVQARGMMGNLMNDMRSSGIPFTSVNLDLTIRILKETSDREGFESLMKWGYGIDLSNPDCAPLEYLGMGTIGSDLGMGESSVPGLPYPQPFSTAALNTTIDMLGRLGDVSKLVQAFEVLTQPLPQASQHLFSSFDDEDDFGVSVDSNPKFKPPHASPNTTTYNMLLRHLARAGHAIFARHYLLEAISLDRTTDRALRQQIHKKPLDQIPPHILLSIVEHSYLYLARVTAIKMLD
ncbi:hypothetical protein BD779DRAFT_1432907 [Infundibulicybe gibba]|nr:hypothetical protein BD779DRAFT_1432907 [Infundibulicybe gibba]